MIRAATLCIGLVMSASCQSAAPAAVPASLIDGSTETIETLKTQIAAALGRDHVTLGQADLTQSSTVTIVPPPLGPMEKNSTAMPIRFDLFIEGDIYYAINRATGEKTELIDIPCRAV